jgi:hypothetical protein
MIAWLLAIALMGTTQPLDVALIASDNNSNVEDVRTMVAWTPGEFAALWRVHAGLLKPPPAIDFAKRTVVAVFLGTRPTPGYAAEIVALRPEGKTMIVEWREVRPKERMLLAQVLTSPALIVSIPKFSGEIGFKKVD